jgi:hypothetical protein
MREIDHFPAGFLTATARELHRLLPSPTLIHLAGANARPVLVSVLLHGNEDAGLQAVQRVLSRRQGEALPRALSIFVGNVEAARAGVRRLDHQPDFNRIWNAEAPASEPERMAASVVEAMRQREVYVALDLHNNSGRNPLYACVHGLDARHLALARRFAPQALLIDSTPSLGAAFSPLCPTITCECGEIGNKHGIAQAAALIEQCLDEDTPELPAAHEPLALYEAFAVLKVAPSLTLGGTHGGRLSGEADVQLPQDLETLNFRPLPAGHVLATTSPQFAVEPVQAFRLNGEAMTGMLERQGCELRFAIDTMAAMLTRDERAIRQDCLGYLIRQVQQP